MKLLLRILLTALLTAAAALAQTPQPLRWIADLAVHKNPPAAGEVSGGMRPPAVAPDTHYVIGPGDVLAIDVWKEKEISQTMPVRPDGDIALPLAGTLRASGLTPEQLEQHIAKKLSAYITDPVVTVMVDKVISRTFQVLGSVLRPGSFPLVRPTRILQALALAGGFTSFAHPSHIVLLHWQPDGRQVRYTFNYSAVIQGKHLNEDRQLQPGDTLIVP
ncbi:MAG: polysaccharide biosynthesis/export family protein [Terriglobales bacterium]